MIEAAAAAVCCPSHRILALLPPNHVDRGIHGDKPRVCLRAKAADLRCNTAGKDGSGLLICPRQGHSWLQLGAAEAGHAITPQPPAITSIMVPSVNTWHTGKARPTMMQREKRRLIWEVRR